jgi:hypothetical protein
MTQRHDILKANETIRRGNERKPRRLPDGEVTFRIPDDDWPVLMVLRPDLKHPDAATRMAAWQEFRHSPLAEKYLVVRTPTQVRRSNNHRIITR